MRLATATDNPVRAGDDPAREADAFAHSIAASVAALTDLAASLDALGAEILEFQIALLDDAELLDPVRDDIAAGRPADAAWLARIDAEIADYAAAEDSYMAARAADLRDLRDRVLNELRGGTADHDGAPDEAVIIAEDLAPSTFLSIDWNRLGGAALTRGSATSHVAILARARGVPMIVGLDPDADPEHGETVVLDADEGQLITRPGPATLAAVAARQADDDALRVAADAAARRPAMTRDGQAVKILVNVDDPGLLAALPVELCDGLGLMRSEFLFADHAPDEAAQLSAYTRVLRWADGRPVSIRTLDAGGDKPVPGVTIDGEANPFLGVRGLRLSLARPALFRVQLRALARAAALGPLKVMLPMVTVPAELEQAAAHLDAVCADLAADGIDHVRPPLGIMVETPAAALTAADFDADFYSIGSNDLIQYTTASARDAPELAGLADPHNPAVLELIRRTVAAGRSRGVEVSLCGDMASQPTLVPLLLSLGLDTLSVAPALLGRIKLAVADAAASEGRSSS